MDAWFSVGRAQFILDNLIAAKKAKPIRRDARRPPAK